MTTTIADLESDWAGHVKGDRLAWMQFAKKLTDFKTKNPTMTKDKDRFMKLYHLANLERETLVAKATFVMDSEIETLLIKSMQTKLHVSDQELVLAVKDQNQQFKAVSTSLADIQRSLVSGPVSNFASEQLSSEQEKRIGMMLKTNINLPWSDVIGMREARTILDRTIVLPVKQPKFLTGVGATRGILLYGPPGTGKTYLAKAAATSLIQIFKDAKTPDKARFFNAQPSDLLGSFVGETEKNINALFRIARMYTGGTPENLKPAKKGDDKAMEGVFSIIFMDEVDGLAPDRNRPNIADYQKRALNQLIMEMDGLEKNGGVVFFIAGSNLPWDIDDAVQRRLGAKLYVQLPTPKDRLKILSLNLGGEEVNKLVGLRKKLADATTTADKNAIQQTIDAVDKNRVLKQSYLAELKNLYDDGKTDPTGKIPLAALKTAFFSNSDLSGLSTTIQASTIDRGLISWWVYDDASGGWKRDVLLTEKTPIGGLEILYVPDVIKEPEAEPELIKDAIVNSKRSISDLKNIWRYEWYSINSAMEYTPRETKMTPDPTDKERKLIEISKVAIKDVGLWLLFNYHMGLFSSGNEYAQEIALMCWRAILKESTLKDDDEKKAELEGIFGSLADWGKSANLITIKAVLDAMINGKGITSYVVNNGKYKPGIKDGVAPQIRQIAQDYFEFAPQDWEK